MAMRATPMQMLKTVAGSISKINYEFHSLYNITEHYSAIRSSKTLPLVDGEEGKVRTLTTS